MMKNFKNLMSAVLICVLAIGLSACSDDMHYGGYVRPVAPGYTGVMRAQVLSGVVRNTSGVPVEGVEVNTGGTIVQTNADGFFTFDEVNDVNGRVVVRFSKAGFADVVRAMSADDGTVWDVVLCPTNESGLSTEVTYSAGTEKTIAVGDMKVELPSDIYEVEETGADYSGQVTTQMVYLDPNADNFAEQMPGGDLAAVRSNGTEVQLVSYGMTAVNLTDGAGNKLQLKDGAEATLTFPIPAGMETNAPRTIPIWSFDEQTGLWLEDGVATLEGDHYTGTVHHFSWWNLDYPYSRATLKGKVVDTNGNPIPNTTVYIGQVITRTDANGEFERFVPSGEAFNVWLDLSNEGISGRNITVEVDNSGNQVTQGDAVEIGPFYAATEHEVVFTVPVRPTITGRVLDGELSPVMASLQLTYDGTDLPVYVTSSDGTFSFQLPYGYTGDAVLRVTTLNLGALQKHITLTGADINVGDIAFRGHETSSIITVTPSNGGEAFTLSVPSLTAELRGQSLDIRGGSSNPSVYFSVSSWDFDLTDPTANDVYADYSFGNNNLSAKLVSLTNFEVEGNTLYFSIEGQGGYYDANTNESIDCSFSAENLAADITFLAQFLKDAQPRNAGFPAWTPVLSTASPFSLYVSVSPWGKGGLVCYDYTEANFNSLKSQATAAGLQEIDSSNYWLGADAAYEQVLYYADNKLCAILYNEWADPVVYDDWKEQWQWNVPGLQVRVFDNVPENKIQAAFSLGMMGADEEAQSVKLSAKSRLRK